MQSVIGQSQRCDNHGHHKRNVHPPSTSFPKPKPVPVDLGAWHVAAAQTYRGCGGPIWTVPHPLPLPHNIVMFEGAITTSFLNSVENAESGSASGTMKSTGQPVGSSRNE